MIKKVLLTALISSVAFSSSLYKSNVDLYTDKKVSKQEKEVKIDNDLFTVKKFITNNNNYDWIIDPDIVLDKEYRYSTFGSSDWTKILVEIAEYEDLIVHVNKENKTVRLYKKIKTKVEIGHLPSSAIESILKKIKVQYTGIEIYKYKNVIYLEGERTKVNTIIDTLQQYNEDIRKSMTKFVVNVYKMDKRKTGLTPMIDKFNNEKVNKVILKNPKLNKGYLIKLGIKQLIIKINSNNVEINGAIIDKSDLKYYGYSIDNWFVEIKSVQI